MVLDDGKMVECGSYNDLMRMGGYLAKHLEDFKVNTKGTSLNIILTVSQSH